MSTNMKLLAKFVEEGLAGLGVLDDVDELIAYTYEDSGEKGAREAMERYNNAIDFVNETIKNKKNRIERITEEDFEDYTS